VNQHLVVSVSCAFGHNTKLTGEKMEVTQKDFKELTNLSERLFLKLEVIKAELQDLGWEYQRMSSSGQETYNELCKQFGLPEMED
jgi:hypothetical protein